MELVAADANSSTTIALFTLAGALGGVLLTSVAALTTAILNHRWQREDNEREIGERRRGQLHTERLEVYRRYFTSLALLGSRLRELHYEVKSLLQQGREVDRTDSRLLNIARSTYANYAEAHAIAVLVSGSEVAEVDERLHALDGEVRKVLEAAWKGEWTGESDDIAESIAQLMRSMRQYLYG